MGFHPEEPPGHADEALLARAAAYADFATLPSLTAVALRNVTDREGVDFATALLYDRVSRWPRHANFIRQVDQTPNLPAAVRPVTVAVVPAAFYREMPHTGADGRVVRAAAGRLGFRTELIPVPSTGTLARNASVISDWLDAHREETILVSLCKGGADVKSVLNQAGSHERFSHVRAWVNICGTVTGSPFAQWLLATKPRFIATWIYCKCQGHDFQFLREIVPDPAGPLSAPLQLPAGLRVVNILGFPLRRHLSNGFMRRCHGFISPQGPNDGGVLLAEACGMPGEIYPVWGADHYLLPEARAERILTQMFAYLSAAETASSSRALETAVPGAGR